MAAAKQGLIEKNALATIIERLLHKGALPGEDGDFTESAAREAALFVADAAIVRSENGPSVSIGELEGDRGRQMSRIAIVNDDMPFLVDSLAQGLSARGIILYRIIHPLMKAERDAKGRLIAASEKNGTKEGRVESIIYIETARIEAEGEAEAEAAVREIMANARAATSDWLKLQIRLGEAADALPDGEGAALLRWLLDHRFTLLASERIAADGRRSRRLGIASLSDDALIGPSGLERTVAWFQDGNGAPLMIKSDTVSPVHRHVLIDLIIVPVREDEKVVAVDIVGGLWTSAALMAPPTEVPMMRAQLARMIDDLGFDASGHAGKALVHAMTQLPHDVLIGFSLEEQQRVALTAMSITDRPRPELVIVQSPLRRQAFAFVWIPRDDVSTRMRVAVGEMLTEAEGVSMLSWSIGLEDGQVALLRFTLDMHDRDATLDEKELDRRLKTMVRGWLPAILGALAELGAGEDAARLARDHAPLFSAGYRLEYGPEEAARDILRIAALGSPEADGAQNLFGARLYSCDGDGPACARLKIYHLGGPVALSNAVPALENFGFVVSEERPSELARADRPYIHDFTLELSEAAEARALIERAPVMEEAIVAVLTGAAENDGFNALMVKAGLNHRPVVWLRAFFRYLRQTGLSYSMLTVRAALTRSPTATRAIVDLLRALHQPDIDKREARANSAREAFDAALVDVTALDEDRVLRLLLALVEACLRTNAFTLKPDEALAFKIASDQVPGLPKPVPWREIFVYSPRLEGVHLRAGPVARGGIRWSDRRDDFRTEILDLMKAQRVKNAVIVPTGAKGGFYPKHLPDPQADREGWAAEGQEAYRIYIRSLLSLTDNLDGEAIVHPDGVVRRDGDDPYFVVAADKGTARFSDTANALAEERGFWLGDAFASGGSNGYDHKAMGITARGAWKSVERHFAELGMNVNADEVRVAGVGDMSGDVFGNGMLLSKTLKLVAAFDHRHIFIDPDPDPASSWEERARLFELDRSSWDDYDKRKIGKGGGVFARSAKSIPLSPEMRALLDLDGDHADPQTIMAAILRSQVDLLWFGGIGTYVKSARQSHADVGDPSNDRLRVDGGQVGARVIGEGANLGVTQAGRIEYALTGGRINTDFIDNSAGVDCSDNEVNIKIALNAEMRRGDLTGRARNGLLRRMTDDVAEIVLEDNRLQALGLSIAEHGGAGSAPIFVRLIERFEESGRLDRDVEGLADNETLLRRAQEGKGLQRPELAVLFSTAKLWLQDAIERCEIGRTDALDKELLDAFPDEMRKKHKDAILHHRLRNEIVATRIANRLINRLGPLHAFELAEEEGAGLGQIAEAYWIIEQLLGLQGLYAAIDDAVISEDVRIRLFAELGGAVRGHMGDLVRTGMPHGDPGALLAMLTPHVERLSASVDRLLGDDVRDVLDGARARLIESGAPEELAQRIIAPRRLYGMFGIIELSERRSADPVAVTGAFIDIGRRLDIEWIGPRAAALAPSDPWDRLLLAGVVRDMQQIRLEFLGRARSADFAQFVDNWIGDHEARIGQFRDLAARAREAPGCTVSMLAQMAQHARLLLTR